MGVVCAMWVCRRTVAALGSAVVALALLPTAALGQDPDPGALRTCPVPPPASHFTDRGDILEAHVGSVDCAASFDIVAGFADSTYRPHLAVRRDQMASFIVRTLDAAAVDLPPADEGRDFVDVDTDNPHRDSIRRLEAAGIVAGGPLHLPDHYYGPSLPVRRDQMAALLDRTATITYLGFPSTAGSRSTTANGFDSAAGPFPDVAGNVHATHIQQAAAAGLVRGFPDGTFRPSVHTRRDHMATFITRLLHTVTVPVRVEFTEVPTGPTPVGQTATVTVTVYNQFDVPVRPDMCRTLDGEGLRFAQVCAVTFQTNGPAPTEPVVVEPDASGQASLSFTAGSAGPVTVTATIPGFGAGLYRDIDGDSDSTVVVFTPSP